MGLSDRIKGKADGTKIIGEVEIYNKHVVTF